jgi:UDPglucose 6-dehydrogenase
MLITDIKTAALYKYLMNSYLAAKVTFMNDFYQLSQAEGVNWKELTGLTVWDDRIGHTHMSVPGPDGKFGWGGICFPKDIAAIIEESLDLNAGLEILDRVEEINKKHRKKND